MEYYVLEPSEQPGTRFYVPTQNPAAAAKIKTILTKEELLALLRSPQVRQDVWIEDENRRKQCYRDLISGGDRAAILSMVHALHRYRQTQQEVGKKLHLCDEGFLRDAQRLLSSEFSLVLEIPPEEVGSYIRQIFSKN